MSELFNVLIVRKNREILAAIGISLLLIVFSFQKTYAQAVDIVGLDATYCNDSPIDTLRAISPSTKIFSGDGVTHLGTEPATGKSWALFDPSDPAVGIGISVVTYFGTDFITEIIAPPDAQLDPFTSVCDYDPVFAMSGGTPVGGIYIVNGTDTITSFNPGFYGEGSHTVRYVAGSGGCTDISDPEVITVYSGPDILFATMDNVCENDDPFTLDAAAPAGGDYSGPGVAANVFTPADATDGTHTITYEISNLHCTSSETETITVEAVPLVGFIGLDPQYCDTDPADELTGSPTDANGVFTGAGLLPTGPGIADFDPGIAGLGFFDITYTYTTAGGCVAAITKTVQVGTEIHFSPINDQFCEDDAPYNFTYSPGGGTFSGLAGLTDNLDGTATFDPAASGDGTRIIKYTLIDGNGCTNVHSKTVTVSASPIVDFAGLDPLGYCINDDEIIVSGNHAPEGTFTGPSIIDEGDGTASFHPNTLTVGGSPYSVTYSYTDAGTGCYNEISRQTNILPLPTATISGTETICTGENATLDVNFTGTGPFDFTYTDGTSSNDITNVAHPYALVVSPTDTSVYTIVSVTAINGCSETGAGSGTVNVLPLSAITANPVDQTVCPGDNVSFSVSATGVDLTYQWRKDGTIIPTGISSTLNLNTVSATDDADYDCVVSSICGADRFSAIASLTVLASTSITTQPADDVVVCEDDNTSFTVTAAGPDLSYTWTLNGSPTNGPNYSGSLSNSLLINSVDLSHEGVYICQVSGSCGDINSDPSILTVNENISITTQPINQTVCPGINVQFEVQATGTDLTYQWQHDGDDIGSATNNTLLIPIATVADEGVYRCRVSGYCGFIFSDAAILTLTEEVAIQSQTSNQTVCEGNNVSFTVAANGENLSYQWKKNGGDLENVGNISGAKASTLNLSSLVMSDQAIYSCEVSNTCGFENTIPSSLTVDELSEIVTQPVEFYAVENGNASFSISAEGTGNIYQWYDEGGILGDGGVYSGVTTSILTLNNLVKATHEGSYYCIVTGVCNTVTSDPGVLHINLLTVISGHPDDQEKCEGEDVNFDIVAEGTNSTYRWKKDGNDLEDDTRISGSTTTSLHIDSLEVDDAGSYSCLVTGDEGFENSFPALLIVNELTDFIVQPLDAAQCEGGDALFVIQAEGALSYQWRKENSDVEDDARISGSETATLSITDININDDGVYTCFVTGICTNDVSNPATLTVNENTSITDHPAGKTACAGTPVTFSVTAEGGGITYQWKVGSDDLEDGGRFSGVNTEKLSITGIEVGDEGAYSCLVTGPCGSDNSLSATLIVSPQTFVTVQPISKNLCEGDDAIFALEAEGLDLTYAWSKEGDPMVDDGTHISGSQTNILIISDLEVDDDASYQCLISGTCGTFLSDPADLLVNELVEILEDPSGDVKCFGQSATFSVLSADLSNTFQWKKDGVKLIDGVNISGANTSNLTISNLTELNAGVYSCLVSGVCDSLNSGLANLEVLPSTVITIQPLHQNVDEGDPVTFTVEAEGVALTYQWQKDGTTIGGANSNIFTIASTSTADEASYTCLVTGTCNVSVSDPANLTVNVETLIDSQPTSLSLCEDASAVFAVTATGEELAYQWRKDGVIVVDIQDKISGATSPNLTISPVAISDIGAYTCVVTGSGGEVTSNVVTLDVNTTTAITTQPTSVQVLCSGEDAFFIVHASGDNLTYIWKKDNGILADGGNVFGSGNEILTVSDISLLDAGRYTCEITGTCGSEISDPSTLTVNQLPDTPGVITGDNLLCQGDTKRVYEVPNIDHATTYEWSLPYGATIEGDPTERVVVLNFSLDALGGNIIVRGKNYCGVGVDSNPLNVTISPKPEANAGADQSLCSSNSNLLANDNPNGVWTVLSGYATITDPTLYNTEVTSLGRGDNMLIWTVSELNCTSRDTVVIANNIVSLDAGPDQVICDYKTTLNAIPPQEGTASWIIAEGGANIIDVNDPSATINNIQQGTNILEWTINNFGCISKDTVLIVNDLPTTANAGQDSILGVDIYTLEGNTPTIGSGMWSLVSGGGTLLDPLSPTTDIIDLGFGENIYKWVITNNSCFSEDEVILTNCIPSVIEAGFDQILCEDSTRLSASQPNFGEGSWTVVQGEGKFKDAFDRETDVTAIGYGENIYRWTIRNQCETSFDDVNITNNSPVQSNAGIDQRLCSDETNLSANSPSIGTGEWLIVGGAADISDANSNSTLLTNLSQGTTTLRWVITNETCTSSDEVSITNDLPTIADAGEDQITCEDSILLFPNTPSVGVGEWSIVSGSASFEGNKARNLATDDNNLRYSISNNGCVSSDEVLVTSNKPSDATTISDKSICENSMVLPGNDPAVGVGEWSLLSGSADFTDASDPTTLATNIGLGLNRLRWSISYNGCTSYSEFNLNYDLIISDAGEDQTLCDDAVIMSASNPSVGEGLWTVVGGSGSAIFTDATIPNTEVTGLDRGENLLRWTVANGSCISYDAVVITNNNPSEAYAGPDREVCGEAIYLNANSPSIGTGQWSVLSGSADIDSSSLFNSRLTNLSLGHNALRWTITNEGCTSTDEISITNNQPTNIDAGLDQYLCSDETQLYAEEVVGGTGKWSIAKGAASFEDNTLYNTDVNTLQKGENELVWKVTIEGCSNTDTILVVNNTPSTPSAGPDQDICSDETFMAANVPQIGTGHWSMISGSAVFEDSENPYTRISEIGNGENQIHWITTNGSCQEIDEVLIINSLPTVAYAGEDRAICNSTANLLANPPITGTGTWSVVSGFGVIEDVNDNNTQITMLGFGDNTLRWTTENDRCKSLDDVIITNNLATANAGIDEIVYYPSITLVGNKPQTGTGEWQLAAGSGNITNPSSFETTVTSLGEGANMFYWTINNDGCIASDNVLITYYILPEVDFEPTPQNGCPPLTVDFINSSVGGYPYSWDFGDGTDSDEANPMHLYEIPGTYNVKLTGTGPDGILVVKDTVVVVREQPIASLEVSPRLIYISNPPNEFDPPVNFFNLSEYYDSVRWEFGDGYESIEDNPLHYYLETGIYDVTLHVETGFQCYDYETITGAVTVLEKGTIECPNVFTPNLGGGTGGYINDNDYSNDVFHCYATGLLDYHLEVFNRLGILMFETEDINIGWDGYFSNELAPEGVYVFRISGSYNNGEKFSQVGSVMIIYNE